MIYEAIDNNTGNKVIGELKKDGAHLRTYLYHNVKIKPGSLNKICLSDSPKLSNNLAFSK